MPLLHYCSYLACQSVSETCGLMLSEIALRSSVDGFCFNSYFNCHAATFQELKIKAQPRDLKPSLPPFLCSRSSWPTWRARITLTAQHQLKRDTPPNGLPRQKEPTQTDRDYYGLFRAIRRPVGDYWGLSYGTLDSVLPASPQASSRID